MKYLPLYIITFLISCSNNNTADQSQPGNSTATENNQEIQSAPASPGNGIVGEWEQQYTCFDKNGNYKLEPDEKKPSNTNLGFNWFRFNADGSCLRDKDIQFKGTYTIQEENANKILMIQGGDNLRYSIAELTNKELIIGSSGAFIVFRRIK
ncbi:MAG TPA: lipocalin family protein [Chitinophagaceae bacterium]|nr:lipocalin family protein [Chitinophagaceae bacterium]